MSGLWKYRAALAIVMLAAIAAGIVWLAFPPLEHRQRVLFIPAGNSPHGQSVVAGVRAAAEKCDVDLVVAATGATVDSRRQKALLDQADAANFDGVLLSPVDAHALNDSINALVARTHVITCGVDAEGSLRTIHVGLGAAASGSIGANLVRTLLPEGGQIAVLLDPGAGRCVQRLDAIKKCLAYGAPADAPHHWTISAHRTSGRPDERAVRDVLAQHPDVDCLMCFNPALGSAAAEVLAELPRRVKVVVFEPTETTLEALAAGRIDGVVADDPFELGRRAMTQMATLFRSSTVQHPVPGLGSVYLAPEAVTRENLAAFRARCARRS